MTFVGYDVSPVIEIANKIKDVYQKIQPLDSDPMLDSDERELLAFAEKAGFKEIHLDYHAEIKAPMNLGDSGTSPWEAFLKYVGNPKIPSMEEAMAQVLTPVEIEVFTNHMRPLVDSQQGTSRFARAYLWAVKG